MIDAVPPTEVADAERFERFGVEADAGAVAQVRQHFTRWLQQFFVLDEVRRSDIVLALNEALANAAEFAYVLDARPGTIDVQGVHDARSRTLEVCVEDRGTWRKRQTEPAPRTRGRGIPLMETLSDSSLIEPSTSGTTVKLEWRDVTRR